MFEQKVHILNEKKEKVGSITGDIQPYLRTFTFEDGYSIDMTQRFFCDRVSSITLDGYIEVEKKLHKVIHLKTWSDYLEVWLYECDDESG